MTELTRGQKKVINSLSAEINTLFHQQKITAEKKRHYDQVLNIFYKKYNEKNAKSLSRKLKRAKDADSIKTHSSDGNHADADTDTKNDAALANIRAQKETSTSLSKSRTSQPEAVAMTTATTTIRGDASGNDSSDTTTCRTKTVERIQQDEQKITRHEAKKDASKRKVPERAERQRILAAKGIHPPMAIATPIAIATSLPSSDQMTEKKSKQKPSTELKHSVRNMKMARQSKHSPKNKIDANHSSQQKENSDPRTNRTKGIARMQNNHHDCGHGGDHDEERKPVSSPKSLLHSITDPDASNTIQLPNEHHQQRQLHQRKPTRQVIHCPIIDPRETKQGIPLDQHVKDMFREMCVFGSLNFIQPPSCLSCSLAKVAKERRCKSQYQSPSSPAQNNQYCQNRVVWRRDANKILDPDNLEGNILLVTCATAQAWLRDEIVDNWEWDVNNKVLLRNDE